MLRAVEAAVDPNRALREYGPTLSARRPQLTGTASLAAALSAAGRYDEAIKQYEQCASGS